MTLFILVMILVRLFKLISKLALLTQIQKGNDAVLTRYCQARYTANLGMLLSVDGLQKLFSNSNGFLSDLRGLGLNFVNSQSSMKKLFVTLAS